MQIGTKITLALLVVLVLMIGASYSIEQSTVLPSFHVLEQQEARKDLGRCIQAVNRELEYLDLFAKDWATWDDLYEYVVDTNKEFEENNFAEPLYAGARLNLACVVDIDGKVVFRGFRGENYESSVDIMDIPEHCFAPDHSLVARTEENPSLAGLVMTEHGPLLIASRAILTSEAQGPVRGTLIMGRLLDPGFIQSIAQHAEVQFNVWPIDDDRMPSNASAALASLNEGRSVTIDGSQHDHIDVYSTLNDIYGNPALLVQAAATREISKQGEAAVHFATLSLLFVGVFVLAFLLIVLQRIVVGPLTTLTRHAMRIGDTTDMSIHIDLNRSDEIGVLGNEFNRMVDNLADSQRKLASISRDAGMAEIASGVLHNIGNVMTNTLIIASSLGKKVQQSKVAGLGKATELLAEHEADLATFLTEDKRGMQLPAYLSQLAVRLQEEQSELTKEIETLAHGLVHMQDIMDTQQKYATRSIAMVPTSLCQLMEDALKMLQDSLNQHEVLVDMQCDPLPVIVLDRGKLLQVVVNLMTNAKDAMVADESGERHLKIRIHQDSEDRVRIDVTDTGMGIDSNKLTQIFSNGFTTKSTGCGYGLHYCALSVQEMQGAITVSSDGPGHGATFSISLPLVVANEGATV